MIELVIFDFDGVLVDTQEHISRLEWEFLSKHGMHMSLPDYSNRFFGNTATSVITELHKEHNVNFSNSLSNFALEMDEAVLGELSRSKVSAIPGVREILENMTLKKCVASNCPLKILKILLLSSGLHVFFNNSVFSADMVNRPKPFPDLFLFAAHSMGIDPASCLVIEDSEVGVKAGVSAGMLTWGFLGGQHINLTKKEQVLKAGAQKVFPNMKNLKGLIQMENEEIDVRTLNEMIKEQLQDRGIQNKFILNAMRSVPRHIFVPKEWQKNAYEDRPLPIGYNQTISQPYIVAYMCELAAIKATDKVLEIGTGTGYEAAILSFLAKEVYSVEVVPELGLTARKNLKQLGYMNVRIKIGNGYDGWIEKAPYDVIIITAAISHVPQPLIDQLKEGGRIIMPYKNNFNEVLTRFIKKDSELRREEFGFVRFVPFQWEPSN
ncbi:MAG: protein-L-isoaspartate(D-aspartate) O-methyltransferase [Alphaproteobacteria bacterium]|nr:protein-L-isoaspartate(D-aspartate) O-methyltransferase [Alphaproteobacteria bacterium]